MQTASAQTITINIEAGDGIQEAIDHASPGDTVLIKQGMYIISERIQLKNGIILRGEVSESGDLLTKIVLEDYSDLKKQEPLISLGDNTKILYLSFDGNSGNQDVPKYRGMMSGNGYHNFLGAQGVENIEVAYCNFDDNLGDGLRVLNCDNIKFHHNQASNGGHDVLYTIKSESIEAYNNTIKTKVNSALRAMDCSRVRWHDNYIYSEGDNAGLALQIQHDSGTIEDIEICYNYIESSYGPGLWLVGKNGGGEELYLHHNVFQNCGYNVNLYLVGGIVASGYENARIEHNVFENCYLGAVNFWDYSGGSWSTGATTTLKNNIFLNSIPAKINGNGGYGVNNEILAQKVVSQKNCYWGNDVNTRGCSVSSTDYFVNPKAENTLCDIKWDGSKWVIPGGVRPRELRIEDVETESDNENDFEPDINDLDALLGFEDVEVVETGLNGQTVSDFHYKIERVGKGKVAGYVEIVGVKNLVVYNGTRYVSSYDDFLIKSSVIRNPDLNLWSGGLAEINKDYDFKIENGYATVTMTVTYDWYNIKTNKITGTHEKSKLRTNVCTFKSEPKLAAEVWPELQDITGYVREFRGMTTHYTTVKVPVDQHDQVVQKIVYRYNGTVTTHHRMLGLRKTDSTGQIYTTFSDVNFWEGGLDHYGDDLYINGTFDMDPLQVEVYTPYTSKQTDLEYTFEENDGTAFDDGLWYYVLNNLLYVFGIKRLLDLCSKS